MTTTLFIVRPTLNGTATAQRLINTGCLVYRVISKDFVQRHWIKTTPTVPVRMLGITGRGPDITYTVKATIELQGHCEQDLYFYVVQDKLGYNLILGKP
ncbi:hypothetical protein G3565_28970 [Escherichia coli]|nr:hypothetical protein [Escherichia coli]